MNASLQDILKLNEKKFFNTHRKKNLHVYAELTLLSEKIPWTGIDGFEGLEPLIEVAAQRSLRK